jgi:2,3-bisphosphoglycerate-independent phosphoglycerate mutase
MKKILFIVLDGAADKPCPELNGKTPLEAAKKPHLDGLAHIGINGLVHPIRQGFAPESDSAAISLLGYDSLKLYTGRGPLEAYGAGLEMHDGDLAFRINFATHEGDKILDRRVRGGLTDEEAAEFASYLEKNLRIQGVSSFNIRTFRGYRGVLLLRRENGKFSGNISNTDPGYLKEGAFGVPAKMTKDKLINSNALDDTVESAAAAKVANEFVTLSSRLLENHPLNIARAKKGKKKANLILLRDAGNHLPHFEPINEKYNIQFGIMADMPCERAIGSLMNMELIEKPESLNPVAYEKTAELVIRRIKDLDALYIHLKGPDTPGHEKNPLKKKKAIEMIDKHFLGTLLRGIETSLKDFVIIITSDHATPCSLGIHSADAVPITILGMGKDYVKVFSEKDAKFGSLGVLTGQQILPGIMNQLN